MNITPEHLNALVKRIDAEFTHNRLKTLVSNLNLLHVDPVEWKYAVAWKTLYTNQSLSNLSSSIAKLSSSSSPPAVVVAAPSSSKLPSPSSSTSSSSSKLPSPSPSKTLHSASATNNVVAYSNDNVPDLRKHNLHAIHTVVGENVGGADDDEKTPVTLLYEKYNGNGVKHDNDTDTDNDKTPITMLYEKYNGKGSSNDSKSNDGGNDNGNDSEQSYDSDGYEHITFA